MISLNLRILIIIYGVILIGIIFSLIKKNKLPIKYSLFWLVSAILIILVGAIPSFVGKVTKLFGFEATSSFVIAFILTILLVISLILTVIVSKQRNEIILLIQEISILKHKTDSEKNDGTNC